MYALINLNPNDELFPLALGLFILIAIARLIHWGRQK